MPTLTNQELINRVPWLKMLTPDQIYALNNDLTKKRFKRNECVVEYGKQSNALFIILAGRARVVMTNPNGRVVILAKLQVGDCIGEMSLIDNDPHSATVIADIQLDVLIMSREAFLRCLMNNPMVALSIMRGLVKRLRLANQKISSFALMEVSQRVAIALLESAVADNEGKLTVQGKLSHLDIAKMVGASREMVTRTMKKLEAQSFIEKTLEGVVRVNERRKKTRS